MFLFLLWMTKKHRQLPSTWDCVIPEWLALVYQLCHGTVNSNSFWTGCHHITPAVDQPILAPYRRSYCPHMPTSWEDQSIQDTHSREKTFESRIYYDPSQCIVCQLVISPMFHCKDGDRENYSSSFPRPRTVADMSKTPVYRLRKDLNPSTDGTSLPRDTCNVHRNVRSVLPQFGILKERCTFRSSLSSIHEYFNSPELKIYSTMVTYDILNLVFFDGFFIDDWSWIYDLGYLHTNPRKFNIGRCSIISHGVYVRLLWIRMAGATFRPI